MLRDKQRRLEGGSAREEESQECVPWTQAVTVSRSGEW